jgi:hypothetical protein
LQPCARWVPALGIEDVVAITLDLIKDLRVQHPSGPDTAGGTRWQHRHTRVSEGIEGAVAFDFVRHEGPPLTAHFPAFKINIEEPKIILRKVDLTSIKVLIHVAKEVGELKRQSQGASRCLRRRVDGL